MESRDGNMQQMQWKNCNFCPFSTSREKKKKKKKDLQNILQENETKKIKLCKYAFFSLTHTHTYYCNDAVKRHLKVRRVR